MREVYAGKLHTVTKTFYHEGQPQTASEVVMQVYNDDAELVVERFPTLATDHWTTSFYAPKEDGIYTLIWHYTDATDVERVDDERLIVVTPYAIEEELRDFHPDLEIRTTKELQDMERLVRAVINSYCRQSFGRNKKTVNVYGNWRSLDLPTRMFRLQRVEVAGRDVTAQFAFNMNNPYTLMNPMVGGIPVFYDIKSDTWYGRQAYASGGRVAFRVTGWFGYEDVPSDVNLAAKLLIRDYFLDEAKWREAGVDVLRAADWRIEYASHPATTTGNVNVDMMLEQFRDLRLMFI